MRQRTETGSPPSEVVTRRTMMGRMVAGTIAWACGCAKRGMEALAEETAAQRRYREFPDKIPGARKVTKKIDEPGARHCLVIINQLHIATKNMGAIDKERKEMHAIVRTSQIPIRSILLFLHDKIGLKELYDEGVTSEHLEKFGNAPLLPSIRALLQAQRKAAEGLPPDQRTQRLAALEKAAKGIEDPGMHAGMQLNEEGLLSLKPTFTNQVFERAAKEDPGDSAFMNWRETLVLELIAKNGDVLPVVTYGSAHDFENNVREWNAAHPLQKFSLIIVEPDSLPAETKP